MCKIKMSYTCFDIRYVDRLHIIVIITFVILIFFTQGKNVQILGLYRLLKSNFKDFRTLACIRKHIQE